MICGMAITLWISNVNYILAERKPCLEVKPKRIMCLDKPTLYDTYSYFYAGANVFRTL